MTNKAGEYLHQRGVAPHVIQGGIPGLLNAWQAFVESVESKIPTTSFEYLNDLDVREILQGVQSQLTPDQSKRLDALDQEFRSLVQPSEVPLVAMNEHQDGRSHWWYFHSLPAFVS
ncbi:MAG: hypothetical protein BGO01_12160 [Armatimonadetes bacterium 55-13]|nr:hypothetical protein [Armatimonadota bacterium]OJU63540.1 MAG: hypothetical protein BGO01_12160 [Armatimonadetes bacterium 55-13]